MPDPTPELQAFVKGLRKEDGEGDSVSRKGVTLYLPTELFTELEALRAEYGLQRQSLYLTLLIEGHRQFKAALKTRRTRKSAAPEPEIQS